MISKVYNCKSEVDKFEILTELKANMAEQQQEGESKTPSIRQAIFGRNHRKGTWVILGWTFFFMWTGIDALNMYSNVIINRMNEPRIKAGQSILITAEFGTTMIGAMQFIGSILAYYTVYNFERVKLLVWGHILMGVLWSGIGLSTMFEYNILALIQIACFLLIFALTEGAIIWIYCAEALTDTQLGVGILGLWINQLLIAFVTEYIIQWIEPEGLFFIFSVTTLLGAVYIKTFLHETQGLSDFEKKNLYLPKTTKQHNLI
jgi:hypothetical protein